MALFSQYAIAAAEEALGDAGLLGNMSEAQKDMTVCIHMSIRAGGGGRGEIRGADM